MSEVIERAKDYLERLADKSGAEKVIPILETIVELGSFGAGGTMRKWFEGVAGEEVHTFQIGYGGSVWMPGERVVDEVRPSGVSLGGSYREFKGMRVQHVSPWGLIVESDHETIAYIRARA